MASMQTRLALAESQAAESAWKRHRDHCPRCIQTAQNRRTEPCAVGAPLRTAMREWKAELKAERLADKAVPEGQGALF